MRKLRVSLPWLDISAGQGSWEFGVGKFIVYLFVFLMLLTHNSVLQTIYAAPCYGTHMPSAGKWIAGAQAHIITNRKLKNPYGKISSSQYFYQMSWGIFDRFCLDGKIGAGDVTYRAPDTGKTTYPANFAGGYSFRVKLYRNDAHKIDAVAGFQHISVHPGTKKINETTNYVILDDWQGSALISKGFGVFTPYVGGRLTRLDLIHRIKGEARKRKKTDVDFGAVAGIDFNFTESSSINIEGRFIEETSFNVGITHNF